MSECDSTNFSEGKLFAKIFENSLNCDKPLRLNCSLIISEEGKLLVYVAIFNICEGFSCCIKIKTPVNDPKALNPHSMKLKLSNSEFGKEIGPCINYLQRLRSPDVAVFVLQKLANYYNGRSEILNTILSEFRGLVKVSKGDDNDGMLIECIHHEKILIKCTWKIKFDIYSGNPVDQLSFLTNKSDKIFYNKVVKYLKILTLVSLNMDKKKLFWKNIMKEVATSVKNEDIEILDDPDDTAIISNYNNNPNDSHSQNCSSVNDLQIIELDSSDSESDIVLIEG